MTTADADVIDEVVDTDRYPLSAPDSPAWDRAVLAARERLHADGCCVLTGFVRPELTARLQAESALAAPLAHHDVELANVYNTPPDPHLPPEHPAQVLLPRGNAFVARDQLDPGLLVQGLYASPLLQRFLAACFELPEIHELADPLAGLVLNVLSEGHSHPWHFDTNELAISMLTQAPEAGGTFEYCPDIRTAEDEHLADVAAVLAGEGEHRVSRLQPRVGDLQLFRGRYSLHRVTAVRGGTERHSAIFAYSARPGVVGSVARTRQLFGRVLPEHLAAEGRAVRLDQLMD
ncbi:arpA protein [Rhodococcus sp. X156]|uniref:HalD/BesD family halogenase n=1 Tax=Rhodococcus sp. X156 TaxID=2499145 RepID=UPI000FD757CD|nr:arpA protein [Rhodococcus sp. X156]